MNDNRQLAAQLLKYQADIEAANKRIAEQDVVSEAYK